MNESAPPQIHPITVLSNNRLLFKQTFLWAERRVKQVTFSSTSSDLYDVNRFYNEKEGQKNLCERVGRLFFALTGAWPSL